MPIQIRVLTPDGCCVVSAFALYQVPALSTGAYESSEKSPVERFHRASPLGRVQAASLIGMHSNRECKACESASSAMRTLTSVRPRAHADTLAGL
jgi:hypothetical protein